MNEKEELRQAKAHLRLSIQIVRRDLQVYHKAVLNRNKAVLKNVGNNIIGLFNSFSEKANLDKLEKQKKKLAKEQEELQEEIRKTVERIQKLEEEERLKAKQQAEEERLKQEKKEQKAERRLNFKRGVKQKVNSVFSKFGSIKNSVLKELSLSNIDSKIRAAFEGIELFGINAANSIMKGANTVKNSIINFTSEQIAKYRLNRINRKEMRAEKKRIEDIEKYDVQSDIANNVQDIMKQNEKNKKDSRRRLNFKSQTKQKTKSSVSRLGKVNNSLLFNLRLSNIDAKLRNAFDNVQLFGMNVANGAMKGVNVVKENVSNFTSEQIAKYSEWRINRLGEKEYRARRQAEEDKVMNEYREKLKVEEKERKQRTNDHKISMMEALSAQERKQYDAKHEEFLKQRQELIKSLIAEKNKLLGTQVVAEYVEEEPEPRTR